MRKPSRRVVLGGLGLAGVGLVGTRCALPWFLRPGPPLGSDALSPEARRLVEEAFADLDRDAVWDAHVHLVGLPEGGNGAWVNPRMRSHAHPVEKLRFEIYLAAAGVVEDADADARYLRRLLALHRLGNPAGKLVLFAFDHRFDESGRVDLERSSFHTPDAYVLATARANADVVPCASVHPYRADALARLDAAAAAGAVGVKWLPNAMGIDLASPRCDTVYAKLVEHDLTLVVHTGKEMAVHAAEDQALGNPLRLRRPLDAGVRVVAAHCASLGRDADLDAAQGGEVDSFDLFLRLLEEERYHGRLFGEISALTQFNRSGRPLRELLRRQELHPRLVNGSDYPLPAIDPLVSTRLLVQRGLLAAEDRPLVNEVFEANPLLFDLVLKRRLRLLEDGRTYRFQPVVFESRRVFRA
jgi:mannonate dehydratase